MVAFEHAFFVLSTFFFPPVATIVILVILLATFGKSLGLRQIYVDTLISIFEWGAGQIKTTEMIKRKESQIGFILGEDIDDHPEIYPLKTPTDSEMDESEHEIRSVDSDFGDESTFGLRRRYGSGTSLVSINSVCSKRSRRESESSNLGIIRRETQIHLDDHDEEDIPSEVFVRSRGWAAIHDSVDFVKAGIEAIIEDEVTSRFEAEQLMSWNMLTRTSIRFYQFVNWKLSTLWILGFAFRYIVMLPLRFTLFTIGLIFLVSSTAVIGMVPEGSYKRSLNHKCMLICYRILSRSLTAVVYFHDEHYKAKNGGICVANHTSPIDALILSIGNVYAMIGQKHEGLLGLVQRALSRASSHIWFERSEAKDREKVADRLREHCSDPNKLPVLIFPEGTCINNTSVMMFKKGCFEIGSTIYPIAMKYDSRFGDAFWNSSEQSWCGYIMRVMTSWAIICNVWYLPPMERLPGENAIDFANRVKKTIAKRGGLVDLEWDGGLKRSRVPPKMVAQQQQRYANRLARYTSASDHNAHLHDEDEELSCIPAGFTLNDLPEDVIGSDVDSAVEDGPDDDVPEMTLISSDSNSGATIVSKNLVKDKENSVSLSG
ncbi:unnamed protein product [Caenorhabditis auriculariae]|uniref:Phospholipid/glycerol acyltransferase domain-containing protein n=1 Tax=Caenorhabditis auriculariae TaxID=2777116 RepID=A0A8S1GR61_9PELO|nr:unnamed protein product [Caenorhabditis auriculariae]